MCQCRGHRFNPWSRKIPHAPKVQLSPSTTTTEACVLRAHAPPQEKSLQWKACSVQFSSCTQSYLTFWDLTDCNMPGFSVHHQLPELAQTHAHWLGDAIQPSHPLFPFSSCPQSFPASGSFQMSQLCLSGDQSIESQLQHQSFQWKPRTYLI